jgi:hypothetical protein
LRARHVGELLFARRSEISAVELGTAALLLLALGFVLYASHIAHGGFYYDDWANAALTAYPPHHGYAGAVSVYFSEFGFRPLLALYVPTVHELLGLHEHWHIAWSVLLLCVMAAAVYLTLRTLGFERIHAFGISALTVVFPFSDSSTLWSTASTGHLVAALYLIGLVLAIRGLKTSDRRRARWYLIGSLLLYAAAVTTYELVATVALASVLIYLWQSTPRKALTRFAFDAVVVGAALIWTTSQTAIDVVHSGGGAVEHARTLADQGLYIVAQSIEPFGTPARFTVLACAAAVFGVGAVAWRLLPPADQARKELGRWLATALGGLLFTYIAWAVFIPADPYYEPTTLGVGNRVNAFAVIGLVTLAYALAMIVATLLLRRSRRRPVLATCLALLAAVALAAGYSHRVRADIAAWDGATSIQNQVFAALKHSVPRPVPHSTIFAYGFTNYPAPGVPSFAASWDLNGAAQIIYHTNTVRAYPIFTPSAVVCTPALAYPAQEGYTRKFGSTYGHTYLVNVASQSASFPRTASQCAAALGRPPAAAHTGR